VAFDDDFTIDIKKFKFVLEVIKESNIKENPDSVSTRNKIVNEMLEKVYNGELLGEETHTIRPEMRPIYFGLKNVILKEIETIDKEIDIKKFFFETSVDDPG
jgi:hypothetical protein